MEENEIMEYFGLSGESGSMGASATAEGDDGAGQGAGGANGAPETGAPPEGAEPGAPGQARDDDDGEGGRGAGSAGSAASGKVTPNQAAPGQVQPGQILPNQPTPGQAVTGQSRTGGADGAVTRQDVAYLDNVIRGLGITDPYTGKAVTTKAEYDAYRQRAYDERREAIKRRSGLTDAELDEFVNSTPAVQRAMADAAAAKDMMARQRQAEAKRRIDAELTKISALDPGVKTLADLTDKPYSGRLTELVRRGYDLADAYVVANQDALRRQSAEASRQAAYNAQAGKAGMTATKQTGQGGETLPVPRDVLEMYRALNPEMTNAEIRDDYNKYLKGRK